MVTESDKACHVTVAPPQPTGRTRLFFLRRAGAPRPQHHGAIRFWAGSMVSLGLSLSLHKVGLQSQLPCHCPLPVWPPSNAWAFWLRAVCAMGPHTDTDRPADLPMPHAGLVPHEGCPGAASLGQSWLEVMWSDTPLGWA